jgi:hypothetical protein
MANLKAVTAGEAPATKKVVARTSVESDHLEALLNGSTIPLEVKKKYMRLIARARAAAEFDNANG